ncbi:hypothetical protein DINM_003483 [Dirofilaria immitis]|nr:hypothetical protein [Dirofilaria immitis]
MVHWNGYSAFVEKAYKCNDDEEFCASLYDRHADNWFLRAIPLDKNLRSRIDCNIKTFKEGCFMDPRYNSYQRSVFLLPVCICKGDYCNTQEKIENVWLEQNIYKFRSPEDCRTQLDKQKLTTKSVTLPKTEIATEISVTSQKTTTTITTISGLDQEVTIISTKALESSDEVTPEMKTSTQEATMNTTENLEMQILMNTTDVSKLYQNISMTFTEMP